MELGKGEQLEMTRYERIKIMTIEEMAHLISVAWNHTDYEDDDWDPGIMEWLRSEAEETAEDWNRRKEKENE